MESSKLNQPTSAVRKEDDRYYDDDDDAGGGEVVNKITRSEKFVLTAEGKTRKKFDKLVLDDADHLGRYGFKGDRCDLCQKKNSEISGLLMQCSKCKKAYYCSKDCFNKGKGRGNGTLWLLEGEDGG